MNLIKPEKYSTEWYELATTDELIVLIQEARHLLEINPSRNQHSLWEERIRKMSQELSDRKTSGEEWEEP